METRCKNCKEITFLEWRGNYCSGCEDEVLKDYPDVLKLNKLIDQIQGKDIMDLFKDMNSF